MTLREELHPIAEQRTITAWDVANAASRLIEAQAATITALEKRIEALEPKTTYEGYGVF